jgi:hypothetical protein
MSNLLQQTRDAQHNLSFNKPLDPEQDQAMLVDLNEARGTFSEERLLWKLGISSLDSPLDEQQEQQYILFGGHRGCGKSTELRRLAARLHRPEFYYVILVDALAEVDINNLRYCDILLAQAKVLMEQLERDDVQVAQIFLDRLENWFEEHIEKREDTKAFAAQVKAGARAETGIPFLGKLFAEMTSSISTGSTYKTEVRNIIRNNFTDFAAAFNALIQHVEEQLQTQGKGKKLLFVVDGTDRLQGEDADNFFIRDVHQLRQIRSNFIYCTPIDLLTESGRANQEFEIFRLPMIKLKEKGVTECNPVAVQKLTELIHKRVDPALFADESILPQLLDASGGHIRDLMRLLSNCLTETLGKKTIDLDVAQEAIRQLAVDYRRLIPQDAYRLLVEIDNADKDYTPTDDTTRRLLYDLVLLEYNSYWWQSHPVVRQLPAYIQAQGG